MFKKIFRIGLALFIALISFGVVEIATAGDMGRRVIVITSDPTRKLSLPPPCSIVEVKGKIIALRDFYGKTANIEVGDITGMKVGDKVIVKDGLLITGQLPQ